ncbi:glucose-6-phosphate dehydrogenase [Candidatus Dependentiae bacterium]|nr:glucose-6-phosphate dehydrogenase [Candidatus Dependentiae bacterium]
MEKHNSAECSLHECTIVILGGTGDLSARKLIPAIYKLVADNRLCKFSLVCVSNDDTQIATILERSKKFIPALHEKTWAQIQNHASYYRMDFHEQVAYQGLGSFLNQLEKESKLVGNRMFYLATMPEHFDAITHNLAQYDIVRHQAEEEQAAGKPWSRVVYEKPFGTNLQSAQQINRSIAQVFDESQVFRIDHWLGKELVSNIALVRFTNRIFEPLWNNQHIDSVQIIMNETLGIEGRGRYYDTYGILKDMVQNHMLQLLALIAMEAPHRLVADDIRDAKAEILRKISVASAILGQYDGYLNEADVNPESTTPTFAALKVYVNNPRWDGVPFHLKTGKLLDTRMACIHIKFKKVDCLLDACPSEQNSLTININPHEGFYLVLNVKIPGVSSQVTPVTMNFSHAALFGPNTPEAYELLLSDVIRKDHATFVRNDEIELSWNVIEQIDRMNPELCTYAPGSKGPTQLQNLDPERKIQWHI